jgi:universal stress protein E
MSLPIAMPIVEMTQALKARHSAAVTELLSDYALSDDQLHILEGNTRDVLSGLVEKLGAGAVLMGAVARGALQRLMLGSTAELVLDHLACDLIIVKPPAESVGERG